MNPFFQKFVAMLVDEANARGAGIDAPTMDDRTAKDLLDLARVVAHSQERRFAPLACYLAGVAIATIRVKQPQLDIGDYVKALRVALEPQEDSGSNPV
ncbi:MAG TPA: DUF6457 domain-containing protein [Candidatus Baltobacteraceae bacterium]|jgi:hypothetical protein